MRHTANMAEDDEALRIEVALHGDGWAEHTSLARELRTWARLAQEVNAYTGTVDDYTNDLCSRDYLEEMQARASLRLRHSIDQELAPMDLSFRMATVPDTDERLASFFAIDSRDGWWWRRRPSWGPLAEYLAGGR